MKMNRFNYNADNLIEAKEYLEARSRQFLHHIAVNDLAYRVSTTNDVYYISGDRKIIVGVEVIIKKNEELFQSLYILNQFRHINFYKTKLLKHTILTTNDCGKSGLNSFLIEHDIAFVDEPYVLDWYEYNIISDFYGNLKAKRSGVHLMNHIDEGLYILGKIKASENAKKAYCLHPIIQSDEDLSKNLELLKDVDPEIIKLVMEYRDIANEYLSKREINSISEIRLSELKDVNDMLIADKIQNKKDFELYHKGKHERSLELTVYFENWLTRLGITNDFYNEAIIKILEVDNCFKYGKI